MKYFIDTEFIESFHKPLFGKRRHFIDLISIGIVAEDGREYYAVSNEFNAKHADDWVYENVLNNILLDWVKSYSGDGRNRLIDKIEGKGKYGSIKVVQKEIGKSNKQIAKEIIDFCKSGVIGIDENAPNLLWHGGQLIVRTEPEFYGYYSDYDWVLFCSLFGRMIDLPKGFPMFCIDINQTLEEKTKSIVAGYHKDLGTKSIKMSENYPKQENEHNALSDARWNKELYNFLQKL